MAMSKASHLLVEYFNDGILLIFAVVASVLSYFGKIEENIVILLLLGFTIAVALSLIKTDYRIILTHRTTMQLNNQVQRLNPAAALIEQTGLEKMGKMDEALDDIIKSTSLSTNVFVLCKYFGVFEREDVKEAMKACLNKGGNIRILICDETAPFDPAFFEAEEHRFNAKRIKRQLTAFKDSLGPNTQSHFSFGSVTRGAIYGTIIGLDNKIYVQPYLHKAADEDCPALVCRATGADSHAPYHIFRNEFENMWKAFGKNGTR